MLKREEFALGFIALLAAVLVAATQVQQGGFVSIIGTYCYWIIRIGIEAVLFLAIRLMLERLFVKLPAMPQVFLLAVLISHVPFVLAVTAFDIILGFPELGIGTIDDGSETRISAFSLELIYLFDNHLALCLLLSFPRFLQLRIGANSRPVVTEQDGARANTSSMLISAIDPPLIGSILWVKAEEHYVKIVTTEESRMILSRFSDVIRELSESAGMQVHRSHWIADAAVVSLMRDGQNLRLVLESGEDVPVSRTHRHEVESRFESLIV